MNAPAERPTMGSWKGGFWFTTAFVCQYSLRSQWLRKSTWVGTLVFSACVLILFSFSLGTEVLRRLDVRVGCFWAVVEFIVSLTVARMFTAEHEGGALEFLLSSRSSRASLLLGKVIFTVVQILTLQIPVFALWLIFYNLPPASFRGIAAHMLPICLAFNLATATLGSLITCITARSLARDILVPVLFFPLQFAVLLGAVNLTLSMEPSAMTGAFGLEAWWAILFGYTIIFGTTGFLLSSTLFEE